MGSASGPQAKIGKSPSNGIGKPGHLNVTTGIDHGCFVRRLPTCLIIRSPRAWREDLFALIRECASLDWLLLTKRPQNILRMLPPDWGDGDPNVWLGMTAEDQMRFDQRWKLLQKIPASIKFVSYEPALGPLRLPAHGPFPDWLISGGESGGGARPVKRQWIRDVIADCRQDGVAVLHKQWGVYRNNPLVVNKDMSIKEAESFDKYGKGGGWVDGKLVREFPVPRKSANRDAA
jgi:protein gp37